MTWSNLFKRVVAAVAIIVPSAAHAAWDLNMPQGVTELTHEVYGLHMLILWICVVLGMLVFGAMLYSVFAHRKSRGVEASQFHESATIEIVWTVIPFLILIGMVIPAAGTLIESEDSSDADLSIKVTGYQWLWHYKYIDQGVSFYSRLDADSNAVRQRDSGVDPESVDNYLRAVDNRVVVPVDKKVRLLLTSNDVIHSWWVPELAGKKDAIPGYINDIWFRAEETGVYRGQCAELCGRGHAYMPIVVEVVSQDKYQSWLASKGGQPEDQQASKGAGSDDKPMAGSRKRVASAEGGEKTVTPGSNSTERADSDDGANGDTGDSAGKMSKSDLMAQGKKIYTGQCASCHQADGSGLPSAGFPPMKGSEVATGPLDPHIDQVLNGKNVMPAYKNQFSNKQIAAVITYQRNAFGNETGDVVQPSQIEAKR